MAAGCNLSLQSGLLWGSLFLGLPLGVVLAGGGPFIGYLRQRQFGQFIREDGPQSHHAKAGTPTAGGILILVALFAGSIATLALDNAFSSEAVWLLLVTAALGWLGWRDDSLKIFKRHNKGVTGYTKLAVQWGLGIALGGGLMLSTGRSDVDVFGLARLELGFLYPLFTGFVVAGTSNAVNLTDGLDGLAAGSLTTSFLALLALLLLSSDPTEASLAPFCLIFTGGLLGFLWYNRHPARIFMGDTGSLALGGALAALAILGRLECWLLLVGGVYVAETLSVILQVASFKTTGKRIFKMSPLHHHFELCGWSETRVVATFIAVQALLCAVAILGYKVLPPLIN